MIKVGNMDHQLNNFFKLYIYIYIAVIPWDLFNSMKGILTGILIVFWLLLFKKNNYLIKLKSIFLNKPLLYLVLFVVYAHISLLWSKNIEYGINALGNYFKYWIILIPILYTSLSKDDVNKLFMILVSTIGLYAVYSLFIYFGIISIFAEPNGHIPYAVVTVYMAINIFFVLFLYLYNKEFEIEKYKKILIIIGLLSFFALVVNNGRIGQISFILTTVLIMVCFRKSIYSNKKILFSLFFGLISMVILMFYFNKVDRYSTGFNELLESVETKEFRGSWGPRAYMWYVAADTIPNHLLIGAGIGDTFDEIKEYVKLSKFELHHHIIGYHNLHLDILASLGIVGYILFILSLFILLYQLYRKGKHYFIMYFSFVILIILDGFGDVILFFKPFNNYFIIIFILFSYVSFIKKEEKYETI